MLAQPDGKELVVEQYVEPASAFKAQSPAFEAVLDSATTAGPMTGVARPSVM